jgi:hypothetical protein
LSNTIFKIGIPVETKIQISNKRGASNYEPKVRDLCVEQNRTAIISCLENVPSLQDEMIDLLATPLS